MRYQKDEGFPLSFLIIKRCSSSSSIVPSRRRDEEEKKRAGKHKCVKKNSILFKQKKPGGMAFWFETAGKAKPRIDG